MFDIPLDVLSLCQRILGAGHDVFLVGGGVRDMFIGIDPKDYDLATSATPDQILRLFGDKFAIPTGLQHGTVTVLTGLDRRQVEVTTFRTDNVYLDGRHPSSVTFSKTIEEDLSRRDFTMNAIAVHPLTKKVIDPFDGMVDIMNRVVRTVGDPIARFREDGLRVMRAVRQACQLGFKISEATATAIPLCLDSLRKVSQERVRDELFKILASEDAEYGFRLFDKALLDLVLPELSACSLVFPGHRHRSGDLFEHALKTVSAAVQKNARPIVRFAALLHDIGKPETANRHAEVGADIVASIAGRLRLSNADRDEAVFLVRHHEFAFHDEWKGGDVKRFMNLAEPYRDALMDLRDFDRKAHGWGEDSSTKFYRGRMATLDGDPRSVKELAITGRNLIEDVGMKPGPNIKKVLEYLLDVVLDNPAENEPHRLINLAKDDRLLAIS